MPASDISLGLIGVGRWGRRLASTITASPGMRLAAAASRNSDVASLVPADCRIHRDWQDVVAAPDLQGVVIATPPHMHAEILLAAVDAGMAVFVEKPLVTSRDAAVRLRSQMKSRRATILVDHIHLFQPAFQALQREAAGLGPLRSITSAAGKPDETCRGRDMLWDWAPHDLSLCLALAPGGAHVTAAHWAGQTAHPERAAEAVNISLALAGGAPAQITLSTAEPRHRWFAAAYHNAVLVYRDEGGASLMRLDPGQDIHATGVPVPFDQKLPLSVAVRRFADAIRQGDRDRESFETGLLVVDMIADIEDRLSRRDRS